MVKRSGEASFMGFNRAKMSRKQRTYPLGLFVLGSVVLVVIVTYLRSSYTYTTTAGGTIRFGTPKQPIRIFGSSTTADGQHQVVLSTKQISHVLYTRTEQRSYLAKYGKKCHADILERYEQLEEDVLLQEQLWKYCMLYLNTHGNVYMSTDDLDFLLDPTDLFASSQVQQSMAIQLNPALHDNNDLYLHNALLKLTPRKSSIAKEMLQVMIETSNSVLRTSDLLLPQTLGRLVQADKNYSKDWTIYKSSCQELATTAKTEDANPDFSITNNLHHKQPLPQALQQSRGLNSDAALTKDKKMTPLSPTFSMARSCPIQGGYCCQVVVNNDDDDHDHEQLPIMALRHPIQGPSMAAQLSDHHEDSPNNPYYSTIQVKTLETEPSVTPEMTPNFFDILLKSDCLPTQKTCHRCLKKSLPSTGCAACRKECPCYCLSLCKIRPPPKQIAEEWTVLPPRYKKHPSSHIPKLVHQTWYEPVTKTKYPNMSRLGNSWKQSGWHYEFYSDEASIQFLKTHFPPQVLEAYQSITPGAFKADLFRYCVLLIKGGVYADMDVLLETHLDELFDNQDIGFMVPMDEPGSKVGHRSCLWNGLLAVAPGHPFLARTIELVVNNIRNRFTSVDYDDMLCPNPILSVSHSVDTLFTCGPCILGAAMNDVLGRHMQHEWVVGDVDIWESEREKDSDNTGGNNLVEVSPEDARLLIPGRTVILDQNKNDMGAHRFTWVERNLMVAATDMPDYDDRPPDKEHYSNTHEKVGVYGLKKLYVDNKKANEEIRIIVKKG